MTPWAPLPTECAGREMELRALQQLVEGVRTVAITGAPGIGKTHLAGALATRLPGAGVVVSLAGCVERADVVRAVGDALGVFPCGDEAAVRAGAGGLWLLADDVTPATVDALLGLDLQGAVVLVGEPGEGVSCVELGPLPLDVVDTFAPGAETGNPLHALLAITYGCPIADLPQRLAAARPLAGLPMGLGIRVDLPLPGVVLRSDARDRRILRTGVAALVGGSASESAAWVRTLLVQRPARGAALRASAYGAPTEGIPDPRDILLLRLLAQHSPSGSGSAEPDDVAVWSVAVGARLLLRSGQVGEARGFLRLVRATAPAAAGLLRWVDGDALLALGDVLAARLAWAEAERHFQGVAEAGAAGTGWVELLLSSAEQLALRGHQQAAGTLVGRARGLAREAGDEQGVSASWRASASLAAAMGETLSADQFLLESLPPVMEMAASAAVRPAEPYATVLTRVAILTREGRTSEALRLLQGLSSDDPLPRANLVRRRAELLIREGANGRAARAAREAAALYASVGEHVSSAQSLRVAADALALSGRLEEAANLYIAVIALQVRVQDMAGLERSLLRAAIVDEARGEDESARLRREQRAAVRRARE